MLRRFAAAAALAALAATLAPIRVARASPPDAPPAEARVPLTTSFPVAELASIGAEAAWYGSLVALEEPIARARFGSTKAPTCSGCVFGAPDSVDRAVSDALYGGPRAGAFLGGFPNHLGLAIGPAVAGLFYLEDAVLTWSRGEGVTGNPNGDHELFALAEAFFTAMAVDQTAKVTTGRLRPYYELGRGPSLPAPPDTNLSFFSGHATASFTLASFVSRDVGDWLVAHPLRGSSSVARVLLGRVLPAAGLYGAATLVAVSRIVDQDHYLSDVLAGAAVGALVGNVVYALHFDGEGRPRAGRAGAVTWNLVPFPGGAGIAGSY